MTPDEVEERWALTQEYLQTDALDEAKRLASELVAAFEPNGGGELPSDRRSYGEALALLSNVLLLQSGAQAAVDVFEHALTKLSNDPPSLVQAQVLLNEARLLQHIKQPQYAANAAVAAIEQATPGAPHAIRPSIGVILEATEVLGEVGATADGVATLLQGACSTWEAAIPDASALTNHLSEQLARLLIAAERHQEALPHARFVVTLMTARHGAESAEVGEAALNLGLALDQSGDYSESEREYRRALELLRRHRGELDPDVLLARQNLAELARVRGESELAERRFRELELEDRARNEITSRSHGQLMIGLGLTLATLKKFDAADKALNEAFQIFKKHDGEESAKCARVFLALGQLAHARGEYSAAVDAFQKGAAIYATLKMADAAFLRFQQNLSEMYLSDPAVASGRVREGIARVRASLGEDHPEVVGMQRHLVKAQLHRLSNSPDDKTLRDEALVDVALFHEMGRVQLVDMLRSLSADSLTRTLADWQRLQVVHLSIAMLESARSQESIDEAWMLVARYRSLETTTLRLRARSATDYDPSPKRRKIATLKHQLVRLDVEQFRWGSNDQLLADRRRFEEELAEVEFSLADSTSKSRLDRHIIAGAPTRSPYGSSRLLIVAKYWRFAEQTWAYAMFVIAPKEEPVHLLDLGDAGEIDGLVRQFRAALIEQGRHVQPDPKVWLEVGSELRRRLFDPVLPFLGDIKTLIVLPEGEIGLLPLAALPRADGSTLLDEFDITYDYCVRPLGDELFEEDMGIDAPPCVFGAPTYAMSPAVPADPECPQLFLAQNKTGQRFEPLEHAENECRAIAELLQIEPVLGDAATEEAFSTLRCPEILHVVTHGFFIETARNPAAPSGKDSTILPWRRGLDDSLNRSGLALAGANDYLAGRPPAVGYGDGILFGSEIADMDFMRTDLVCLSACQTGMGKIVTGDGVHGLQRAFLSAGARTVVYSLWDVPDRPTSELFKKFYARVLAEESRAGAFHAAMREMAKAYPLHPIAWAGFVLVGRTAPLARFGVAQLKIASITWPMESREEGSTPAMRAEGVIAKAERVARDGDVDGAVSALDDALLNQAVPNALRGQIVYVRAGINRKAQRAAAALTDYRALDSMPGLPLRLRQSALFDAGTTCIVMQDWANAVERYSAFLAISEQPKDRAMALVNRAGAYRELGDSDSSMSDLEAVVDGVDMPPDQRAKARVLRAQNYVEAGDYSAAIEEITPIIRDGAAPAELAAAHAPHGMALANLGHAEEAAKAYNRALAVPGLPKHVADAAEQLLNALHNAE